MRPTLKLQEVGPAFTPVCVLGFQNDGKVLISRKDNLLASFMVVVVDDCLHGSHNTQFVDRLLIFFVRPAGSYLPGLGSCAGVIFLCMQ